MGARVRWLGRVVASLLLAHGAVALADEPVGPGFGSGVNRFQAHLTPQNGQTDDADDYVEYLVPGEILRIELTAAQGAPQLLPALALIDPDGMDRTPSLRVSGRGRAVAFRDHFAIDKAGPWTVRVSGNPGGRGVYTLKAVLLMKALEFDGQKLDASADQRHSIPVAAGMRLTLTLTSNRAPIARFLALETPSGGAVMEDAAPAVDRAVTRNRRVTLADVLLDGEGGDYTVVVGLAEEGSTRYNLAVGRRRREAVPSVIQFSPLEPALAAVAEPIDAISGGVVRLAGRNLTADLVADVLVGGRAAAAVVPAPDGTFIDVTLPAGTDGEVADVLVVANDGQRAIACAAVRYLPPLTLTAITDPLGAAAAEASTQVSRDLRLVGTGLDLVATLKFGATAVAIDEVIGTTALSFASPVGLAGSQVVAVTDVHGRVVTLATPFTLKSPPQIATVNAYSPVAPNAPGVTVTVAGTGFRAGDTLSFDGDDVTTTVMNASSAQFTLPAVPSGRYAIGVRDDLGGTNSGPDITVDRSIPSPSSSATSFGHQLTVDGDLLAVTSSDITSVGAVHVFRDAGLGEYSLEASLTGSDTVAGDLFGATGLAASGDRVVVGAVYDTAQATQSGSSYVFGRSGGTWAQVQKLLPTPAATANSHFGYAAGFDGDDLVLGRWAFASQAGRADLFQFAGGVWTDVGELGPTVVVGRPEFGRDIAIDGDRMAISAINLPGFAGNDGGSVYLYDRQAGAWGTPQRIQPAAPGAHQQFGERVRVSGDHLFTAAGINVAGFGIDDTGVVYVHVRGSGGTWSEQTVLTAPGAAADDDFGTGLAVAAGATTVAIGAPGAEVDGVTDAGAVYVFDRSGTTWTLRTKLTAAVSLDRDKFGFSLAIRGDVLVVGAPARGSSRAGSIHTYLLSKL